MKSQATLFFILLFCCTWLLSSCGTLGRSHERCPAYGNIMDFHQEEICDAAEVENVPAPAVLQEGC